MASIRLQNRDQYQRQRSLAGRIQDSYFTCMRKLSTMSHNIASGLQQGKQLLEIMTQILRTNIQIFQIVVGLHHIVTQIPGQVQHQQPVFLIDGLGRISPFHLDFIRSADALVAVLAINFQKVGAAAKIQEREFVIEDMATKKDIDLEADWDSCFFSGQRVEMSMVFRQEHIPNTTCPKCRTISNGDMDKEIEW